MGFHYKQVQLLNMRNTKANLRAKPTKSESHERETEQLEGFYSMCFASMCMTWPAVGRIPVSAVLGTLMPALLQKALCGKGGEMLESNWLCTMGINHGRRGRAQGMGRAESLQEGCMPVFCNPGDNKGLVYVGKVSKNKPLSCLWVLSAMPGPLQSKKPEVCWLQSLSGWKDQHCQSTLHTGQVSF